ncbi:MAG: CTP synthase [Candidatus Niyogibacteria bacterium RIFCSPLOWO2_01_FULL_45_48]|uniref:CTP synthase n=2 Tax=Candidatus Niyogiibacteriota TaxID=1817912 RepID=A0A1G2EWM3_9BACT|nr:MAG: CTP synthase [Candidatus Niyogibacteria bacterium RIFCSPHIGHO2_01_FULL_45_28]OGZ30117.1 MAG: CTP synthase [Candidatus Niyogibacteria bacterium RIFCSPLOWO2_02_FULL_45_13]OGZ30148.1 MAG: CTP synthase [Candidatus Niyogibacteria bacterium RIFCSPLOWO2_01_FULL_45_48]
MARYIFIAGGVMSGIGKGVSTAAIAAILKNCGFRASCIKIDPYLNVDAGTMNPVEHGEVFVTDDGLECDQDIGNYERFLDENMYRHNYMTSGQVYQEVIGRERSLGYGGRCVETVPHIPEEVIRRIELAAKKDKADFVLVEIGGTIGEYQNLIFFEAGRMMKLKSPDKVLFVVVSYLPVPHMIGEMKTKPTQHAVRTLNASGIQPDIIIARSALPLDNPRKRKIASFCNIKEDDIISAPDVKSIYEIPVNFERGKISERILTKFNLPVKKSRLVNWQKLGRKIKSVRKEIRIGIVGKYFSTGRFTLSDSYISVIEAVKHSAWHNGLKPNILWLNAEEYEKDSKKLSELDKLDGVIVPGGFGDRGVEGKMGAIGYARRKKIPYLGLCYGMQLAVIEFARSVAKLRQASSTEISARTAYPVVSTLQEQEKNLSEGKFGASMRLGAYPCEIKSGTASFRAYGEKNIVERHRHRYEFNNDFRDKFEKLGLVVAGINPQRNLVEIIELKDHPFFVGVQFHPELKSKPFKPHPLFNEFIKSARANSARQK